MTYSYNGTSYGTVELVALSDVEMSRVLYYSDKLSHFFQSTVFKIVLIAAAVFIAVHSVQHHIRRNPAPPSPQGDAQALR